MKSKKILFVLFIFYSIGLKAQEADQRIGDIINRADWFALEEEYPKLKNKMQSEMLKILSEVLINRHFNNPDKAILMIDSLLQYHQQELGFESSGNIVVLKSQILGEEGRYAESADNSTNFLEQVKAFYSEDNFPTHVATAKYYNKVRNESQPEIIRPNNDTKIPMFIEKAGKGTLMFVPVTVKGKEYRFIFDTGAGINFVSERFANEVGLRIIHDSLTITGIKQGIGKMGTIDSLIVGDIVYKHPLIAIAAPNPAVDTIYQVDAVLGLDFIKRIGETQIFPSLGEIVFPKNQSALPKTGRNLLIQNNEQPYLKIYTKKERLFFHFDTGNVSSDLHVPYYLRHKKQIKKRGTKEVIRSGGFGGISYIDGYRLPKIPLKIGTTNFEFRNITVATDAIGDFQQKEDGALGMSFIKLFEKVTVNFDKMFVDVEK